MDIHAFIAQMESEWDVGGTFYQIRQGQFNTEMATRIFDLLACVNTDEMDCLPRRMVTLLWFIPTFLYWNKGRVTEVSHIPHEEFDVFISKVVDRLFEILGVP